PSTKRPRSRRPPSPTCCRNWWTEGTTFSAFPSTRAGWRWTHSRTTSRPGRTSRNRRDMPEPGGTATLVGEILPGAYRFTIHDDRIDSQSDSYAIIEKGKTVLIDP